MNENQNSTREAAFHNLFPAAGNDFASWMGFLFEWNGEITRFYLQRYQKLAMMPLRLNSCRSQEEIRDLQTQLAQELIEDYRFEASRLSQIAFGATVKPGNAADGVYAASLLKAQQDAATIINLAKEQADRIRASAQEELEQAAQHASETPARKRA